MQYISIKVHSKWEQVQDFFFHEILAKSSRDLFSINTKWHKINSFQTKVGISHKQLERFRILYEEEKGSEFHLQDNFRPVQNLQGRKIYDVETSEKHFRGSANTNAMSAVIIMSVLPLMIVH